MNMILAIRGVTGLILSREDNLRILYRMNMLYMLTQ